MRLTSMATEEMVVLRMSEVSDNKMAFSTVTASVQGNLQNLGDQKNQIDDGIFGKSFIFYTDGQVTLLPGDQLRDDSGNIYTIKSGGISIRQHGNISFTKVVIELTK